MKKIPYSVIGCINAEASGDMFIYHFDARDGEQAQTVGMYMACNGDEVGCVVLGHAQPVDPSVITKTCADAVARCHEMQNEDRQEIATNPTGHSFKWHTTRRDVMDEYLSWVGSVSLE